MKLFTLTYEQQTVIQIISNLAIYSDLFLSISHKKKNFIQLLADHFHSQSSLPRRCHVE
ncbi:hypothetical protein LDENG_00206860 [Lucifuga dentata]|nr:hypothetical protein LDENG_00206860 [Lucifuga dentata]